jgi:hypothetical protein
VPIRNLRGRTRKEWTFAALSVAAVWCVACPRSGRDAGDDPLAELLRTADAAWEARGQGGFEPDHPEVFWRLVRLETARGLAASDVVAAARHYGRGRELGMECLLADPAFAQSHAVRGWPDALIRVPPPREPCLEWTTFAWTRWLAAFGGAAGAMDLATLDLLHRHLYGSFGPDPFALGRWTEGVLYAARPQEEGRDYSRAMIAFEDAIRARPEELARRADLVLLVADPLGNDEIRRHHVEVMGRAAADTPEDRRAQALVLPE